jgi:hypothetical protein
MMFAARAAKTAGVNRKSYVIQTPLTFVPCDARILIGIGVAVIRRTSGVAAVEAVEFGSDTVRRARPGLVTRRALLKQYRALLDVLSQG